MDPMAALRNMLDAIGDCDGERMLFIAENLAAWLDKGGAGIDATVIERLKNVLDV